MRSKSKIAASILVVMVLLGMLGIASFLEPPLVEGAETRIFGLSSIDGTSSYSHGPDRIVGTKFALAENGTVEQVSLYVDAIYGTPPTPEGFPTKLAIYSTWIDPQDGREKPKSLMAETVEILIPQTVPPVDTFIDFELLAPTLLDTGNYWLLYLSRGNILNRYAVSPVGSNNTIEVAGNYTLGFPDPFSAGWCNWGDREICIYATYVPAHFYLTVNSSYGAPGGQGWYDTDSTAYATLNTDIVDHGNETRHAFVSWSGDSTGTNYSSSGPITMDSNKTAVAFWKTQYNVTFTQSGLDESASGTIVTVNDVPVSYEQLPYIVWADSGSSITYSYNNVSSSTDGKRFILANVSEATSPITVTGPASIQGNYKTQYGIAFTQIGVDSDFSGTIIKIDGSNYTYISLPTELWWDNGSLHNFTFYSPLIVNASRQYNWTSTTGLSTLQSDDLIITNPGSIIGNYTLAPIDVTPPEITVLSPQNDTYHSASILLEFTINETTSWIGFSLNGQVNVTITENTTVTVGEGSHWIVLYANDTSGNLGSSNITHFTALTGILDVAVVDVQTTKTVVGQGYTLAINVTVENQGDYLGRFNITIYANTTVIETFENIVLPSGNNTTLTFSWNTTGITLANYTISAYAEPVAGEVDTVDNEYVDGNVYISIPGDINADGKVDMRDIGKIATAFGSRPGLDRWDPNADINDDGKVDMRDIGAAAQRFGES